MSEKTREYDLVVIGGGPGGYVAALRAARLGLRTALVEREGVGGVCLNWGCIPTKALLRSAHLWRDLRAARRFGFRATDLAFDYRAIQRRSRQTVDRLVKGVRLLLKNADVDLLCGNGYLDGRRSGRIRVIVEERGCDVAQGKSGVDSAAEGQLVLSAARVILATGGRPRGLAGVAFDGQTVLSSKEALLLEELPRRLLIVGAGAIGMEFADLFATFGTEVTIVEILPRVLPGADEEVSDVLRTALLKRGIRIRTAAVLESLDATAEGLLCHVRMQEHEAGSADETLQSVAADRVLVAVGVTGNVEDLGLATVGIVSEAGFVTADAHMRTGADGVYAIGDLTGPPLLAHLASAEGMHAAEHAAGRDLPEMDRRWIPAVVFTDPEVASVGLDERRAAAGGRRTKVGRFPFRASGKAVADGAIGGFVKTILEAESGRLLGAHLVGRGAAELVAELTVMGQCGLDARQLLRTLHAHPTLAETIPEALAAALGQAIHI
jgi:dihydrolipoamide dehydrogenase